MKLLEEIAVRYPVLIAAQAIADIGSHGRLRSYRQQLDRFIALRTQSHRLLGLPEVG